MGFGGSQYKDNVWWWFFESLQKGIGGIIAEHVNLIYDIDLVAGLVRSIVNFLTEASDIINASVTGGVNLDYI